MSQQQDVKYYKAAMLVCKEMREKQGLTQENVASKIGDGFAKETYGRYESQKNDKVPKPGVFARILEILHIDRQELDGRLKQRGISLPTPSHTSSTVAGEVLIKNEIQLEIEEEREHQAVQTLPKARKRNKNILFAIPIILVTIGILTTHRGSKIDVNTEIPTPKQPVVYEPSASEKQEISNVVKQAEFYENMTIYVLPASFQKAQLAPYWINDGTAAQEIEKSVQRLLHHDNKGWHYGKDSRVETFDVRSVKIIPPGNTAEVDTEESWYLPLYDADGRKVAGRNPFFPPSPIHYSLRKERGKWLIQSTSTAYAN